MKPPRYYKSDRRPSKPWRNTLNNKVVQVLGKQHSHGSLAFFCASSIPGLSLWKMAAGKCQWAQRKKNLQQNISLPSKRSGEEKLEKKESFIYPLPSFSQARRNSCDKVLWHWREAAHHPWGWIGEAEMGAQVFLRRKH